MSGDPRAWPVAGFFIETLSDHERARLRETLPLEGAAADRFIEEIEARISDYRRKRATGPGALSAAELRHVAEAAGALTAAIDHLNTRGKDALGGRELRKLRDAVAVLGRNAEIRSQRVRVPVVSGKTGAASGRGPRVNFELYELSADLAAAWRQATGRAAGYSPKHGNGVDIFLRAALLIAAPTAGPGALQTATRRAIEHARERYQDEAL